MTRTKWSLFVLVALVFVPGIVWADGGASGQEAISQAIEALVKGPLSMVATSPFHGAGEKLLRMLLLILISYKGIKLLLDSTAYGQILAEIVNIIILWGIAVFFMNTTFQKQFADGFDQLAQTAAESAGVSVAGNSVDVSSTQAMLTNALMAGTKAAYQLFEGTPAEKPASVTSDGWDDAVGWLKEKASDLTSFQWIAALANLFFRVLIALMVMGAVVVYCGQLLISQILVNVGLIVAPLLIPWILWEASAFVFNSWVKFMIVAGMQKIVGALLFGLTTGFITDVTSLTSSASTTASTNFYYYAAAFILMFILGQLMTQISSIAHGLVSGMPSTGFRAPAAMTPAGMASGRAVGGLNASGGARGAAGGAAAGYKAARADGKGMMGAAMGAAGGAAKGMARGLRTTTGPLPRGGGGVTAPPPRPSGAQSVPVQRGAVGAAMRAAKSKASSAK